MRFRTCLCCEWVGTLDNGSPVLAGPLAYVVSLQYPCPFPPLTMALEFEYDFEEANEEVLLEAILIDGEGQTLVRVQSSRTLDPVPPGMVGKHWWTFDMARRAMIERAGIYRWEVAANETPVGSENLMFLNPPPS